MRHKVPYLIIGVLIGIIIMQWSMPVAESQTGTLQAELFSLVNESGVPTGIFFNGQDGPILGLGDPDKAHITMGAPFGTGTGDAVIVVADGDKIVRVSVGTTDDASLFINVQEVGGVLVKQAENFGNYASMLVIKDGGYFGTASDNILTGRMPALPGTATKPVTWGQIKANPDFGSVAKPVVSIADDHAARMRRLEDEYRQKLASLR